MSDWLKKTYKFVFNTDDNISPTKKNVSFLRLAFVPFVKIFDSFGEWLKIASVYALVLTVVSFGCGYSYICSYDIENNPLYCNNQVWLYWLYLSLKFIVFAFFIAEWIAICRGQKYVITQSLILSQIKIKTLIVIAGLFALFGVGVLSGYLLVIRIPNPNWKIELGYFTIVSTGFLVPLLATRFYSLIAYAAEGKIFPSFKTIWKSTSGQTIKILFSLFVILIMMIFIFGNYIVSVRYNNNVNIPIFAIVTEFLFNILSLLFWAVFAGNCVIQTEMIETETKNNE